MFAKAKLSAEWKDAIEMHLELVIEASSQTEDLSVLLQSDAWLVKRPTSRNLVLFEARTSAKMLLPSQIASEIGGRN
jgi:hypothetical protein